MTKPLHPVIKKFLSEYYAAKSEQLRDISADRKHFEDFILKNADTSMKMENIEDITIEGKDGNKIPIRIYTPSSHMVNSPAMLSFHGGGFQRGSLISNDSFCRNIASRCATRIVSVDYRLSPENKFPAALVDCIDSYLWLKKHAHHYQINPNLISVSGESAGANLATVMCLWLKEKNIELPVFQLLIVGTFDLSCSSRSYQRNIDKYYLTDIRIKKYINDYISSAQEIQNPLVSPLLADDLSHLSPAIIITAGYDPFLDEGKYYADKLKAAGVRVIYKCYEEMIHVFLHLQKRLAEVNTVYDELAEMIQKFNNQ